MESILMKYYRVLLQPYPHLDLSLYIEKKLDSKGREYYLQVEDYISKIIKTRIRKSVAVAGISSGRWKQQEPYEITIHR
jgi:hypothetical protein